MTHPFLALSERNFRIYMSGQLVSMSGTWMQMVVQGWLVWQLSHDEFAVGLVGAVGYGAMLLLTGVGGALSDRTDRRRLMLLTQGSFLILSLVLALLASWPALEVWHIAVVAAATGIVNAFDLPTRHALVAEMVPRPLLVNAVALNQAAFNLARILGPGAAALLIASPWVGFSGCFVLNSCSYGVSLAALLCVRLPRQVHEASESPFHGILEGVRFAFRTEPIGRLLLLLVAGGIFGWSLPVALPSMAERVFEGNASTYGRLMTAVGVGAVLGSLVVAAVGTTVRKVPLIFTGLVLWSASLAGFSFVGSAFPAGLFLVGAGLGMVLFSVTANALLQSSVPDGLRGRIMALWGLVFAVSEPLGQLQMGAAARTWGPAMAVRVSAGLMAVCGVIAAVRWWVRSNMPENGSAVDEVSP